MKIERIELAVVALPLVHGFETSSHRKSALEHILIRVVDSEGTVGWGECASPSGPFYSAETTDSSWLVLRDYLAPLLLEARWEHPDAVTGILDHVAGNHFAKAGLEAACWELYARGRQISLSSALGGTSDRIEAGVSLGIEPSIDLLLAQVDRHITDGYRRVKLKVKPGWDLEPIAAVRLAYPKLMLQIDANAAYSVSDIPHIRTFDDFGLAMIEQPFAADDFLAHAALVAAIETPVCLDESIVSLAAMETALYLSACDVINIKVSRLGGLSTSRAVHDRCREIGMPAWCGGMHEFGVGRAANLAIASLPGFTLPSDVSASAKYYLRDIIEPPIVAVGGTVEVPTGAGAGVVVDEEFVAQQSRRSLAITAEGPQA